MTQRKPKIEAFFDEPTNTVSYLVWDEATKKAAIVDPVLDYDHASGSVDNRSINEILQRATELGLDVIWALETHVHADHLSGAPY
ncbi:MAG: MBL fold metallo-hydrolase, partial [Beijerinckiaceae bacterium]